MDREQRACELRRAGLTWVEIARELRCGRDTARQMVARTEPELAAKVPVWVYLLRREADGALFQGTPREIGAEMGLSLAAARKLLWRARSGEAEGYTLEERLEWRRREEVAHQARRLKGMWSEPRMQLCWTCAKACGGCAWSRRFDPVPGWKAERTRMGYSILACPEYEKG